MGDTATQARGKASQAAGAAQNLYGQVVDEVRSFAFNQPVGALLLTMGLGVMLGFLLGRRKHEQVWPPASRWGEAQILTA